MVHIIKRFYHPGFNNLKKLCLPKCPNNTSSEYYSPVWGNKIQEIQLEKNSFCYNTNDINHYSNLINEFYNNNTIFLPTSHNTPIITAFNSLRNLDSDKFIPKISNKILDDEGVFVNSSENRNELLKILNFSESKKEKDILESAIYGIFSNFGDSIYIANDYLNVGDKFNIIANYPDQVSQREIERCRIAAYSLINGNYPIILDNDINFEGEANIKFIPAMINENNQLYQVCITYNSTRSNTNCINNINKYLQKLNLPLLKEVQLFPRKGMEKYFYHLDTLNKGSVRPADHKISLVSPIVSCLNDSLKD